MRLSEAMLIGVVSKKRGYCQFLAVRHIILASMQDDNYFIYIVTNPKRTTLYIGVTNDLCRRLREHYENSGLRKTFAGRYYCYNLIYWERFSSILHAIEREKELKKWRREKKEALIAALNPQWRFLNKEVCGYEC